MSLRTWPAIVGTAIALLVVLGASTGEPAWSKKKSDSTPAPATSTTSDGDEPAIRAQLKLLMNTLKSGNSKELAALWTDDGEYVDEDGVEVRGRSKVDERFAVIFAEDGKADVNLLVDNLRFLSHEVALTEGITKRKIDGASLSRFSLLFVKQNGNWKIARATETALVAQSNYDKLKELEWLVGDWKAEREGASLKMTAQWVQDKNFIFCKYTVKKPNGTDAVDMQVIGWDPLIEQPVSWSFDSSGGFGYGRWFKRGADWHVDTSGVERSGSSTKSTNILSNRSASSFSWHSVNRIVDGEPVGDTVPLQVQRAGTDAATKPAAGTVQ